VRFSSGVHLTAPIAAAAGAACGGADELPGGLGLCLLLEVAAVGLEAPEVRRVEARHHDCHLVQRHRLSAEPAICVDAALARVVSCLQVWGLRSQRVFGAALINDES